jgi:L-alanine-DL-glutamate epimerase-like enolase superfamily enzyme
MSTQQVARNMKDTIVQNARAWKITAELFQPFVISRGSSSQLKGVILEIELKNGIIGYGEASPASYAGETQDKTYENLTKIADYLKGRDISNYLELFFNLEEMLDKNRCALTCAEMSVLDCVTKTLKIPLWKLFGSKLEPIKTDITIIIGTVQEAEDFALKMHAHGMNVFKIKVGKDIVEDIKRVTAVRKKIPKSKIYIDVNEGYSVKETVFFIKKLAGSGIIPEVIEQPVQRNDYDGLKFLTKKLSIPICADESVYSLDDAVMVLTKGCVSAINIKLMKYGILRAKEIYYLAKSKNIKLMIGEMMETELSSMCAAHFAAGLGGFDFIDLDSPLFIKDKVMTGYFDSAQDGTSTALSPSTSLRMVSMSNHEPAEPWKGVSKNGNYDLSVIKTGIGVQPIKNRK